MRRRWYGLAVFGLTLLHAGASAWADSPEHLRQRGETAYFQGRYADSAFAYAELSRLAPGDALAPGRAGISYSLIHFDHQALPLLSRALEIQPDDGELLYFRGLSHYALGDYPSAEADLARAGALRPYFPGLWNHLGLARTWQGRHAEAIGAYTHGLQHAPDRYGLLVNRAVAYHLAGRDREALADLAKAIKLRPRDPIAYNNRALVHAATGSARAAQDDVQAAVRLAAAETGRLDGGTYDAFEMRINQALMDRAQQAPKRSLAALREASALRPQGFRAAYLAALVHFEAGQFSAAAEAAAPAAARPGGLQAEAMLLRGKAFMNLGDYRDAADELVKAVALRPQQPEAHRILGDAYYNQAMLQQAVQAYSRHLEIQPQDRVALSRRAEANYFLSRNEAAIADLDRLVSEEPLARRPYRRRGEAHMRLGRFAEAIADYEAALHQNPDDVSLSVRLAEAHQLSGDLPSALKYYGGAIERNPKDATLLERRGNLLFDLGRYDEALSDYRRGLALSPKRLEFHVLSAEVYIKLGKSEQAIAEYDRALELNANQPTVLLNRGILLERGNRRADACKDWIAACRLGEKKGCEFSGQGC